MSSGKIQHLDGLRGIAALAVANYHLFRHLYSSDETFRFLDEQTPLKILWDGPLAVSIFFILSGRVLVSSYNFTNPNNNYHSRLASAVLRRPVRLGLPILGGLVVYYVLTILVFDWNSNLEKAQEITQSAWHNNLNMRIGGEWQKQIWKWLEMFNGNTLTVFPKYPANVTWTIPVEFHASNLIYLLAFVIPQIPQKRFLLYGILLAYYWWTVSSYALFMVGLIFNDLDQEDWISKIDKKTAFKWKLLLLAIISLLSYPPFALSLDSHTAYFLCYNVYGDKPQDVNLPQNTNRLHTSRLIAGTVLFLLASYSDRFKSLLGSRFAVFLGKISFGLYLCHDMVAQLVVSRVLVWSIENGFASFWANILCIASYYVSLVPISYLFWRYIDDKSIQVSHSVYKRLFT